jgi:cobalt-zinc-cadmium resistance protein CzcA
MRNHSESPGNESDSPDGVVERIVAWSVQQRLTVLVMVLAVAAAGVWALRTLRVDAFPDLTDAQVQVLIEAPGLSPVEVERLTTFPIEVAMNGLPDVTLVRSVSKYGFAAVTVVFEDGVDIQRARTLVSERLQSVREALPTGADATLGPLSAANSEIYMYTVEHADAGKAGDTLDMRALRTLQDRVIRPQLRTVSGVTEVNSFGGEVRQAQVVVRPERLVSFGLTLHDVVEAVESNNAVAAGGYLEHRDEQYILRGLGAAATLDDLRNTVIRASSAGVPVLIGDVADVRYGAELRQGAVSHDGRGEVVSGIVMMLRGENGREVVERVRARVEDINRSLPPGVKVIPYYDQTDLVAGTLRTVRTNLVEGGLLVIAVLLLFLGNVRAALLVAVTIPLSLLCAFLGMRWLGLSANLMSLGAIDFGMIVDGSVVMTEHFVRTLHGDEEAGKLPSTREGMAARLVSAAREVARPIAFGVLIIMLVYVPILSLQGLEARMFRPMAITVAIALFGSLLLALCFIPAASTWVFQRGARESKIAQRMERVLDARYARALAVVAKRPMATVLTALSILVATLFVVPRLGTEFLPQLDEGSLLIAATKDPTISLSRSVAMQDALERTVRESPEVTTVVSRVGRAEIGSDPMGVNQADVFVMLKPRDQWRPGLTKDSLEREITERLEEGVPGIAIGVTQPMQMRLDELISGVRADLAIKIFGDDPIVTRAVADEVAGVLGGVPGADEVRVEQTAGQGYLNVRLNRAAMARFGIPMAEVQEALETAVGGRPVSQLVEGSWTVDVAVYYPEALRTSAEAIGAITVPSPGGARISLAQIADIRLESGPRSGQPRARAAVHPRAIQRAGAGPRRVRRGGPGRRRGARAAAGGRVHRVRRGLREPAARDGTPSGRRAALDSADRPAAVGVAPLVVARGAGARQPAVRRRGRRARALAARIAPVGLGEHRLHRPVRCGGAERPRPPHDRAARASGGRHPARCGDRRGTRAPATGTHDGARRQSRLRARRPLARDRRRGAATARHRRHRGPADVDPAHPARPPHAVHVDRRMA